MTRYFPFLLFISVLISFISCDNETETLDEEALGYTYTPLEIGKYWVYKSDSIVYKLGGTQLDTLSGFIKEEVSDTLIDASNQKVYRIERFFKRNLTDNWGIPSIWTASKTSLNYIRTEENLKFVKLVFPPDLNTSWDGNVFIDPQLDIEEGGELIKPFKGFWDYKIDSTDLVYSNEGLVLDEVLKVIQVDDEDFLEKRYSEEQFAKGVGMVYKKMIILDTQCAPNCIGDTFADYAEVGFIMELSLIESN